MILLHGLGDNRTGMTGYAELLLSHGYSVLMPDARGHRRSDGNLVTFGLLETDDIRRWLDWLQQKNGRADNVPPGSTRPQQVPSCIFGLGESMGAAQLLQALRTETRFCAVVAESPFASFREIGYDRVGQPFNTGPWLGRTILRPIVEFAFLYARLKYKLDFEQVSPEDAVARTKVPISLIHGKADSNIPVRHADLIVARNPGISLWEVPNADHCGAMSTAPEDFAEKVLNWFMSHTGGLGPKSITLELLPATGTALRIGFARRGSSYQHDFRITQALRCLSPPYPLPAPRFAQSREGTQPSSAQCVQQAQHPNKDNYESWISGYRMGPLRSGGRDPHHIQLTISLIDRKVDDEAPTACDDLGGGTMQLAAFSREGTVSWLRVTPLAIQRGPWTLPAKTSKEMKIVIMSLRAYPPEDHSQLPPPGHRVVLQVEKGSKVLARVYDRDNLPNDVLRIFDLTRTTKP